MERQSIPLVERVPFLAGMTALGGFCNAYTCMTRGGVFANAHTANMAKLGVSLATLNWAAAWGALVPILGCLTGGFLCEVVKDKAPGEDWRRAALALELAVLVLVGFLPATLPHAPVNALMSLVTGFQLNIFRTWHGGGHNTTICTGNLRTQSQLLYAVLSKRDGASARKCLTYAGLLTSFILGAAVCALLCLWAGVRASWAGALFLALWLGWMVLDGRKAAPAAG